MVKAVGKPKMKKGAREELSRLEKRIANRSRNFSESERDNPPRKKKDGFEGRGAGVGSGIRKRSARPSLRAAESSKSGRVVVSLRREKSKFSRDARLTLTETEVDPVKMLALLVAGDAVGLGLMTEEEYNKEPIFDENGNIEEPGGKQIAAGLLDLESRRQAARDLLPYLYSKPQDPAPKSDGERNSVIYLPDNGRTYNGEQS